MKRGIDSKYITLSLHIAVWAFLMALPHILMGSLRTPGPLPAGYWLLANFLHIGLFYCNAYYLFPKWMNRKRWWLYILSAIALVMITNGLKVAILAVFFPGIKFDHTTGPIVFFPTAFFLVASIIYRLIVDKIRYEKAQKERQAEQLAMELKFLRSQISPHFLFNVLTNLVSLARKKSDKMEPSLIMLSDLMRYMLYDSEGKKVRLEKEIGYLNSYIELQKLRFGEDVRIEAMIEIAKGEDQHSIEPMLLIPFVENAFKHGIGWIEDPWIFIKLVIADNRLTFTVRNKFNTDGNDSKDSASGIGLANVRSRLKLLYPEQHMLSVQQEHNIFSTVLTLQLK